MLAQRLSLVFVTVQAAPALNRHEFIDDHRQPIDQEIGLQIESVNGSGMEPILDVIGKLFGRADEPSMARARVPRLLEVFTHGRVSLADLRYDRLPKAYAAKESLAVLYWAEDVVGKRFIEFELRSVVTDCLRWPGD
ncbi:hypothetical protein [Phyllobacterium sp. SB3]|uniref:hypothetical protein n=1 Tax=Phyllobacterium sp. SB3 TaxID=3156073 RepID=UPI0032AF1E44